MKLSRMIKHQRKFTSKRNVKVPMFTIDFGSEKKNQEPKGWNIILEGGDCTGKTTVYGLLAQELGILVGHRADKPRNFWNANVEMFTQLEMMHRTQSQSVLYERSFISELIYGIRFRKYTKEQEMVFFNALKYLPENTIIFILTSDQKTLMDRYQARGDSFVEATDILNINSEYIKLAHHIPPATKAHVVLFNNEGPVEEVVKLMAEAVKLLTHITK